MLKESYPHKGSHPDTFRNVNILSVIIIVGVGLFFILFFSLDVPSKILSSSFSQRIAAEPTISVPDQSNDGMANNSSRIIVLPGPNITEEEVLNYLGDMPDEDVEAVLQTIQYQKGVRNHTSSESSVSANSVTPGSVGDIVTTTKNEKIEASKRLRLVQDLNSDNITYYVAEDGDTLLALSKAFGVSLGQLLELNGLKDADVIRAGEILLFPEGTEQPIISVE